MAASAVIGLVNQLSELLKDEHKLLKGLTSEVITTRDQFHQMRAFLQVADQREETDPLLQERFRQLRQIAYEIEDILDNYMLRCAHHPSYGVLGRIKKSYAAIKNLRTKHKIASEIKALRYRAENASKAFTELHSLQMLPGSSSTNNTYYDGRDDALLLEEAEVVGIESSKKQLVDWISATDYTLRVVSVVGMAGLGKTTLVKKVYDDPSVKNNIQHHAWITVTQTYRNENLLQQLITQLLKEVKQGPPPDLETMNSHGLKEFIHNFLQNKKYVIVLDDVWSTNAWEALRYAFPRSTNQGRGCIIITTRLNSIGDTACCESGGHLYRLQPLPPQEAKELFFKKVFCGKSSCPHHLEEISENILRSCEGLPLAIVVIGGVLATKRDEIGEWRKFNNNLRFEQEDDLKRIEKLLSLSYYDLPYYLKPCLLYLSIFPEDHLLEKDTVICLWTAEGFIEAKQGRTLEEIAEGYITDLFNRSLIQRAKACDVGRESRFRIHDLVREYIISKAREHSMALENGGYAIPRRLRLDDSSKGKISQVENFRCLRTLLFFGSTDSEWGSIIRNVLRGGCRMLKELDLRGSPIDEIPNEVFKLYHLKYISLRDTNVSNIPKSIGNLVKLETLDLKHSKVTKLPVEMSKLQRLRCLLVYRYNFIRNSPLIPFDGIQNFEASFEIGQLLCLQKLCHVNASVNMKGIRIVSEIGKLRELRRLGIEKLREEDGKELCYSLAKLSYLTSLSISSIEEDEVIDLEYSMPPTSLQYLRLLNLKGRLEKIPQWIPSLNALTTLRLRWSKLGKEDPLECLQQLPNLKVLVMRCAYEGEALSFKCGGFTRLMELLLMDLRGLKWVSVEEGSMPSLTSFEMWSCEAMVEIPIGIEQLAHLSFVGFGNMGKKFLEKVSNEKKRDGQKWKLVHIPRVEIGSWVDGRWRKELL